MGRPPAERTADEWVDWTCTIVDRERAAWGLPTAPVGAFKKRIRTSRTLRELWGGDLQQRTRGVVCFAALVDAVLDPTAHALRKTGIIVPESSSQGAALEQRIRAATDAVRASRRAGFSDLASEVQRRLRYLRATFQRKRQGRPRTRAAAATYELERVLSYDTEIGKSARWTLIAQLVTDFVTPYSRDQVRWTVKEAKRRDRRSSGDRKRVPIAVFWGMAESALQKARVAPRVSLEEVANRSHFLGGRVFSAELGEESDAPTDRVRPGE